MAEFGEEIGEEPGKSKEGFIVRNVSLGNLKVLMLDGHEPFCPILHRFLLTRSYSTLSPSVSLPPL